MTDKTPTADDTARLRRLRDQLAAEHAKSVRADQAAAQHPDRPGLLVNPHNALAAGLEIAVGLAEHHLREAGEARTTTDNGAASGDTATPGLRHDVRFD